MKAKEACALGVRANIQYIIENEGITVAEWVLMTDDGNCEFLDWDAQEKGCTIEEYKDWVNEMYDIPCNAENVEEWCDNIWNNQSWRR